MEIKGHEFTGPPEGVVPAEFREDLQYVGLEIINGGVSTTPAIYVYGHRLAPGYQPWYHADGTWEAVKVEDVPREEPRTHA